MIWDAKMQKKNVNCNIRNVPNCYSNQNYWAMSKSQLHEFTVWGCVAKGPKYNFPNTNTKKQKGIQLPAKLVNIHESQQSKHFVFLLISWALDSECFTWEILALHEKLNKKLTLISTIGAY